jgi:hypothetical protein
LLAEAEGDPTLIGRRAVKPPAVKSRGTEPFAAMALLSDPALDVRQYLEDLASIAINSARQAEDLAVQAQAASRRARRGMVMLAGFGIVGLLIGMAGFAVSRTSNVRLAEIREEMGTLQDMQRQAQDQLADLATQTVERHDASEQRDAADAARPMGIGPAVVTAPMPLPAPAPAVRSTAPASFYYQPWPDSRPALRRAPMVRGQVSQPVVIPRFFAEIQRGVRGIFR